MGTPTIVSFDRSLLYPIPTLADAILDRIVHNSHRLELGGESMRKTVAEKEEKGGSS